MKIHLRRKKLRSGKISLYKIKIISNEEILLAEEDRPYFQKKLVDSILGENTVYAINDEVYRIPEDISDTSKLYDQLEKPKKAEVKILSGKEAFEKYGVIGFKGVVEIVDQPKK